MSTASLPIARCAPRADRRGDPMLGTAFPAARLLLVEQPHPWGPEGLRTSRFDAATARAVEERCRAENVRVQAIRRLGRAEPQPTRRWALVDTRDGRQAVLWGTFAADAELLELPLDGMTGEADDGPLLLVCTHGKHDPCCALRGRPVATALAAHEPDRVWQASHLGGCRFAPTVLVLPLGLMYGRVDPAAAGQLVADARAGEVTASLLRGRIGIPPAAQAAVAYAAERLGLARADAVRFLGTAPADGGAVTVRVGTPGGEREVTVERERIDATGLTCAHPGPSWFLAHRPVAITAPTAPEPARRPA